MTSPYRKWQLGPKSFYSTGLFIGRHRNNTANAFFEDSTGTVYINYVLSVP